MMGIQRDEDEAWEAPNYGGCLLPLEPQGEVREVETTDGLWLEGAVWWQCSGCGLVRLT